MSLGNVYILLKPVGSARLTFDDDRYYEFMCFDAPKVVRSPGCDHEHDEESQNGRHVKIGILDDYIRTPEVFGMSFGLNQSAGGVSVPPGGTNGPLGPLVERERARQGWAV